jgi:hypothetical protein
MRKFNLQKALEGAKVVTRQGKDVTQLTIFNIGNSILLAAVVDGQLCKFLEDGSNNMLYNGCPSPNDLFMYEPLIESWVNLYQAGNEILTGCSYRTEELAKEKRDTKDRTIYIKTIKITNEL